MPVAVKLLERISHLDKEAYTEEEQIAENVAGVAYAGLKLNVSMATCD